MPAFKPRERKHKKRARAGHGAGVGDTNAVEIHPESADTPKHRELKQALQADQPKMSSKKKKRLDKYIENKLKKEENLDLLKKLAQAKVDTSLLRSSKDIGVKTRSKRVALSEAIRKQKAGIPIDNQSLFYRRSSPPSSFSEDGEDSHEVTAKTPASIVSQSWQAVGVGLKRPLEIDQQGNPVLKKRQRLNEKAASPNLEDIPWEGFGSEVGSKNDISDTSNTESYDSELDASSESTSMDGDESGSSSEGHATTSLFAIPRSTGDKARSRIVPRLTSAFKEWATQQINEARDFTPSIPTTQISAQPKTTPKLNKPRPLEQDPLPAELQISSKPTSRKAFSVEVDRTDAIQDARMKLPIAAEEQKIMEAIHNSPVVVVCGATGSGKTTQLPQFLFEAGYGNPQGPTPGMVGITQPRRVAAVTMAKRVGEELCKSEASSYQIRFDSTVDAQTAIKFMTDGILIREISQDFALTKYSAIVIDEAHERSVNTDILIGMVTRIVDLRATLSQEDPQYKPLKLIIMSATLMTDAFLNNPKLFPNGAPPLVESEGRQHPVTMHFSRRTNRDYVDDAFRKVTKGHRKLPPGSMLVFLTGQNEIVDLVKKLQDVIPSHKSSYTGSRIKVAAKDVPLEMDDIELVEAELESLHDKDDGSGNEDEDKEFEIDDDHGEASAKALILPFYSQLPTKEQLRVFEPPPENTRLIILATNVAETSVTIPGVRYVFDCGRSKEKKYDKTTGVQSFEVGWISKASALQRAGRAGRTGPGHCYRLYSSAVYERDFSEHTDPEILRTPLEGVVLQLKSMDLQNVINFPFPTPPDRESIAKAEKLLSYLGAIDQAGKATPLGRGLSIYPVSPRFAKMLSIGHQHNCIYLTTALVAALAVPELLIPEHQLNLDLIAADSEDLYTNASRASDDACSATRKAYNKAHADISTHDSQSDAIKLLTALCAYMWTRQKQPLDTESFCKRMFLRPKAMAEAHQLYSQLLNIISLNHPGTANSSASSPLAPPTITQIAALKQILAAGFLDNVAIRADLTPSPPDLPKFRNAIDVPYLTLFASSSYASHSSTDNQSPTTSYVFIHPSSILARVSTKNLPPYIVYSHLQRATLSTIGSQNPKTRMHPLTPVVGKQLAHLARGTPLLEYGKPIGKVEEVVGGAGQLSGPESPGKPSGVTSRKRLAWVVPSLVGDKGDRNRSWPLPTVKTVQVRSTRSGEGRIVEWVVG